MVFKRSEYGRVFKTQNHVVNIPTYYDNLTYRNQRRELEYAHTSIAWVDSDSNDETTQTENSKENKSLPNKEMKVAESTNDPLSDSNKQEEACKSEEKTPEKQTKEPAETNMGDVNVQCQSKEEGELKKAAKEKLVKYTCKENIDVTEHKTKVVHKKSREGKGDERSRFNLRPRKVDDKTFVNKPKIPDQPRVSKSASGARPKSAPSVRQSEPGRPRPPFLPYGCGDSERMTGTQRSHNVLASTDVYPAALKAHKKQVEDAIRRKDANVKAAKEAKKRRQLFRDKMLRDAAFWKSEYGFRYPAHPTTEYAKNCDKPKRCKSAFGLV